MVVENCTDVNLKRSIPYSYVLHSNIFMIIYRNVVNVHNLVTVILSQEFGLRYYGI